MTTATADTPVFHKRPKKPRRQVFSMDFWDDEIDARRHIPQNMKLIQQKAKSDGIPTRFLKPKVDKETGITAIGVAFGNEEVVVTKDGTKKTKIVFDGNDYIKVHYDRSRRLPKTRRKKKGNKK